MEQKKGRVRSPNYPLLTLERSLSLTEALNRSHNRYLVPIEVAAKDWDISATSSYISQYIAALSAYGLIDVEGIKDAKKVKVSDVAFKIIMDKRPSSPDREILIKEAALKPNIFRKLCSTYPNGLPDDHALEYELVTTYNFNQNSVSDFITIFKKNIDFANVFETGIILEENNPIEEPKMVSIQDKAPVKDRGLLKESPIPVRIDEREIANYPVGRGLKARIIISGDSPVTMESIEKLIKLLELNKEDLPENSSPGNDKCEQIDT